MRVNYGERFIDVENQSEYPKREFYANWNYYNIIIQKEKIGNSYGWYIQSINPKGGYDYDGYYNSRCGYGGTMSEALQDCFNNIDYPQMSIDEEEDEE